MYKVRSFVQAKLKAVHPKVFFQKVPQATVGRYIIFNFPYTGEVESRDDIDLEINIYDDATDTTELERLTTAIDRVFNRIKENNADLQVCIYHDDPWYTPLTEGGNINRRKLNYIMKIYRKSVLT